MSEKSNVNIVNPRTLPGFMELLPGDQILFDAIKDHIESVYRKYSFLPIDTPVLEHSEVLLAKAGGETEKQIYRFNKGDTDLTMRFDLTVPLAKYVAKNYNDLAFPFRRYQIGKVYRGERAQKGRFREFYQSDIDIVGDGSLSIYNDAEIPSIIYDLFIGLGIDRFVIRINNRKVLGGLIKVMGINASEAEVMRVIDKLYKIGREKVVAELADMGVGGYKAGMFLDILTYEGDNGELLDRLEEYRGRDELLDTGIDELRAVTSCIAGFGVPAEYLSIDLTIARGLDYYTGTVYETFIKDHPEYGSVCSGGRYDNLCGFYSEKKLPGVGISIGLTRLFSVLNEEKFINASAASCVDALVIPTPETVAYAAEAASALRSAGLRVQVYFEDGKFKKKLRYADRLGAPFTVIIGTDEMDSGRVSVKNMTTGEQVTCKTAEAADIISAGLSGKKDEKPVSMA